MTIAITGITGLLGRNLAFELLHRYRDELHKLRIIALGREQRGMPLSARIAAMLQTDGAHYLGTRELQPFIDRIQCVDFELGDDTAVQLPRGPVDYFFHLAASVDFRNTPKVVENLHRHNVEGSRRAIELSRQLQAATFVYVGTAYVSGYTTGLIAPDHLRLDQPFKNPYERSKLEGELLAREAFSSNSDTTLKIFRPSTICGRLLRPQPGQTPKFDVFYAWLAFFLRLKARAMGGRIDYDQPLPIDIRVQCHAQGTLNIIPADYAAQAMLEASLAPGGDQSYHLAAPVGANNRWVGANALQFLNIFIPPFVDTLPGQLNDLERLYYKKSVGLVYTPYLALEDVRFDLASLQRALPANFPACPPIDLPNLHTLLNYAKKYDFGLQ